MTFRALVVLVLVFCGCAARAPAGARAVPTVEVERSARALGLAWAVGDVAALERLLARDYAHTDVSGMVLTRAAWLEQVRTRGRVYQVEFQDLRVAAVADGALVTGRNRVSASGSPAFDLSFTQLWVEEDGAWRRRAFQGTPIGTPATAKERTKMTDPEREAEVRAASAAWADAIQRRDVTACERILGAEYALFAPGLGEMPRATWLAFLPQYIVESFEFSDVRIHVYGETAVMRSRYTQRATVAGKDRSGAMLVTDVWVWRDARWQVVARHTSFLG